MNPFQRGSERQQQYVPSCKRCGDLGYVLDGDHCVVRVLEAPACTCRWGAWFVAWRHKMQGKEAA